MGFTWKPLLPGPRSSGLAELRRRAKVFSIRQLRKFVRRLLILVAAVKGVLQAAAEQTRPTKSNPIHLRVIVYSGLVVYIAAFYLYLLSVLRLHDSRARVCRIGG